jgi:hypothetical protein
MLVFARKTYTQTGNYFNQSFTYKNQSFTYKNQHLNAKTPYFLRLTEALKQLKPLKGLKLKKKKTSFENIFCGYVGCCFLFPNPKKFQELSFFFLQVNIWDCFEIFQKLLSFVLQTPNLSKLLQKILKT